MLNKAIIASSILLLFVSLTSIVYADAAGSSSGKAQVLWVGPTPTSFWKILAMFSLVMLMTTGVFLVEKQRKMKQQQNVDYA